MAAAVAASPATAAPAGNGWSCISPFATYLNSGALADDPPAPNAILNRRRILAALAVMVGGTLAAAAPAQRGQSVLVHRNRC